MRINKKLMAKVRSVLDYFRRHWRRTIVVVLVLIAVFLVYKRATAEPSGITSTQVSRGTLVAGFTANGKINAKNLADLKFNAPGKVAWISVKEGDKVGAWQGVAGLDSIALNANYENALNNLRNFQATADQVLDSVQGHAKDENFTQRATRTTAEVNRDNAYNSVLAAKDALSNSVLVSPFAGTVVATNGLVAGVNLSGMDLESKFVRIVDLTSLYFQAQVDEVDYSKAKVGQEVQVSVDAFPGQVCLGKVTKVGKNGNETTGGVITIPVEVSLEDCKLDLAVNLNGEANFIQTKDENVLVIPKKYIVSKSGQDFVWKQTGSNIADRKLVPVEVGGTNSTEAEVKSGLSEGDKVVYIP